MATADPDEPSEATVQHANGVIVWLVLEGTQLKCYVNNSTTEIFGDDQSVTVNKAQLSNMSMLLGTFYNSIANDLRVGTVYFWNRYGLARFWNRAISQTERINMSNSLKTVWGLTSF